MHRSPSLKAHIWGSADPFSPSQPPFICKGIIGQTPNLPPLSIPEQLHELPSPARTLSTARAEESRSSQMFLEGSSLRPAAEKNDCSNPLRLLPARRTVQGEKGWGSDPLPPKPIALCIPSPVLHKGTNLPSLPNYILCHHQGPLTHLTRTMRCFSLQNQPVPSFLSPTWGNAITSRDPPSSQSLKTWWQSTDELTFIS